MRPNPRLRFREYQQPPCPGDDYIWTPGYWGWQNTGYYWVPGVWVTAPYVDALWTPPYWGFVDGRYAWHHGYWGPHIGFYGGIDYGFGYTGHGYYGGYWNNGHVYYNRSVTNVNTTVVRNVYNYSVPVSQQHAHQLQRRTRRHQRAAASRPNRQRCANRIGSGGGAGAAYPAGRFESGSSLPR